MNKAELQTLLQQTDVIVLFLDNNHFSPMLWPAQRQATAFAPRKLTALASLIIHAALPIVLGIGAHMGQHMITPR